MVKRSTWLLIVILLLAVGAYFLLEKFPGASSGAATPLPTPAFLIVEGEHGKLSVIEISDATMIDRVRLERMSDGQWQILLPTTGQVDQGQVEAAETQLFAMRILTPLETAPDFAAIGLAQPAYRILLVFVDGYEQEILVGSETVTGSGYYVRMDDTVYVISAITANAVLNLLNHPPYVPTAAPTLVSPTETATPTFDAVPANGTGTPSATSTP
ncbi:MAG: DUF4340 domain-containing protein [Chloroflexi bacterium]|nr:DUF4340 domain-containing protein [Chloroflexota bacterium]